VVLFFLLGINEVLALKVSQGIAVGRRLPSIAGSSLIARHGLCGVLLCHRAVGAVFNKTPESTT
jgi:hypothetical protein